MWNKTLKESALLFYVLEGFACVYVCVLRVCLVPEIKGHQIPWNWKLCTMVMQGTEPVFSARATSVLKRSAIFPACGMNLFW